MATRTVGALLVTALVLGCATSENVGPGEGSGGAAGGGGAGGVCAPGVQIACACPGAAQGAQACNKDGTGYEPCVCPDGGGSGGAPSGGGGTPSGGGGTPSGGGGGGTTSGGGGTPSGGGGTTSGGGGTTSGGGSGGTTSGGGGSGGTTSGGGGSGGTTSGGGSGGGSGSPDVCPGVDLPLTGALTSVNGTLVGYGNNSDGGGKCSPSGNGNDVVYRIVPATSGTLTAKVTPSGFSTSVYYSSGTCTPNAPVKCSYSISIGQVVNLSFSVSAGTVYYLIIDSYTPSVSGTFKLDVTLL